MTTIRRLRDLLSLSCILLVAGLFMQAIASYRHAHSIEPWHSVEAQLASPPRSASDGKNAASDGKNPTGDAKNNGSSGSTSITPQEQLEIRSNLDEAKGKLTDEIHQHDADERAVLDRLITLVSVYSAALGLLAFLSVKQAKDDASRELDALTKNTDKEVEDLKGKIASEFPDLRGMKNNLEGLLLDLEQKIPAESNWYQEQPYEMLTERQRQSIFISESTIGALQVFISRDSTTNNRVLSRLYLALARFYQGKYSAAHQAEDFERAIFYSERSLDIEPGNAEGLRVLGATYLGRYRAIKRGKDKSAGNWTQQQMDDLLGKSVGYLRKSIESNENDAGAYYNLALALSEEGEFGKAIDVSADLVKRGPELHRFHVRKFMPSAYVNYSSFLALEGGRTQDKQKRKDLNQRAIQVLEDGYKFFASVKLVGTIDAFLTKIRKENCLTGDFRTFDPDQTDEVNRLVDHWSKQPVV
jgi:tetratricopeptide (TPR) repeat protein